MFVFCVIDDSKVDMLQLQGNAEWSVSSGIIGEWLKLIGELGTSVFHTNTILMTQSIF